MKTFEELNLSPGVTVQLSAEGEGGQIFTLETVYIGSLALHSILVAMPSAHQAIEWRSGMTLAVTIVMPTGVATFHSRILSIGKRPYGYMHLAYPEEISFREVRGAARIRVSLPANVNSQIKHVPQQTNARVLDISVTGLKLATQTHIAQVGDELSVDISMQFAGVERSLQIPCAVRAKLASNGEEVDYVNIYGMQFQDMKEEQRILLHAFVLNGLHTADSIVEI